MSFNPQLFDAILLAGLWLGYFVIHSLLAALRLKTIIANHYPGIMPYYRLCFNLFALLLLAPPLWLLLNGHSVLIWRHEGYMAWAANGLALLALAGFAYSLKFYDGQEFLGLRQIRDNETRIEDQEHLQLSPLHRFARHPWYFFALILVWTRDMSSLMLVTATMLTLYFFLGSKLEEKKLNQYYGIIYAQYCQRVPGIIPLPWKFMTTDQSNQLLRQYHERKPTNPAG